MTKPTQPTARKLAGRMWASRPTGLELLFTLIVTLVAHLVTGVPVLGLLILAASAVIGVTARIAWREVHAAARATGEGGVPDAD